MDYQGFYTVGDEAGVIPEGQQMTEGECNPTAHVYVEEDARFIAANDPAIEIRRVEALLRVVQRHANPHGCVGPDGTDWVFRNAAACPTIQDLATGEGIEVGDG